MDRLPLGHSGIDVSQIIMGSWQAGGSMWVGVSDAEFKKALHAALDVGINTVDTAWIYGRGRSERLVGEVLGGLRHEVVYATKAFCNALSRDKLIAACEASLKNLKTDYIDLYQIHWPSGTFGTPVVPIEETMRAMEALKEQGKIRAIGVSNFNKEQLAEACEITTIDSLQPPYSLFWRHAERDTLPVCVEKSISVLAYSPLAQGILTGKFGIEHTFKKGDHRATNRLFQTDMWEYVQEALSRLREFAKTGGVSLAEVALAWVMAQPGAYPIAGARNAEQVRQNAAATKLRFTAHELASLDAISRIVTDHLDDSPMLWV